MKNFLILLFIVFSFYSCNNNSIEKIDVNKITEVCDLLDAVEIIINDFEKIAKEYGFKEIDDIEKDNISFDDWKKIKMIEFKMEEIEDRAEYFRDVYEDYDDFEKVLKDCPNFAEVTMKMEYYDLD
tara:strand:+ start:32 stop:409 length:378 start_codon:yes stop_codon:yes gene_type:complete